MNDHIAGEISRFLSLRPPQAQALEILARVVREIPLDKDTAPEYCLIKIQEAFPQVQDFERDFVSLCFNLATGIGKTRLMGAFIAYLAMTGKSRHFMVLAPNLTIYEKLIRDFTPGTEKYIFKGLDHFAVRRPLLITGDNFENGGQPDLLEEEGAIRINIFNISKINFSVEGKKGGRIRAFKEYLGQSYFDYLAKLPDLVLLMDEAHRYRADKGMKAINELRPILGLELTATPKTAGARPKDFRNVIYRYALANALQDGWVKEPYVATREDFKPDQFDEDEIEKIKLHDGALAHEDTKAKLAAYATMAHMPIIHPFMLVVAEDTHHADRVQRFIESEEYFQGRYRGKVIRVHSRLSGEEDEKFTEALLSIEHGQHTEIVIHVNKLREGWDVNNLYTIVPLRAFAADILTEQTLGRGLRLPYGMRTGDEAVDRLTIVAHDHFQKLVDEAKKEGSPLKIVTIGAKGDIPDAPAKGASIPAVYDTELTALLPSLRPPGMSDRGFVFPTESEREAARQTLAAIKDFQYLPSSRALTEPSTLDQIVARVAKMRAEDLASHAGMDMASLRRVVEKTAEYVAVRTIDVPDIVLMETGYADAGFPDFDLSHLQDFRPRPASADILLQNLLDDRRERLSGGDVAVLSRLEDYLVNDLKERQEVDYDKDAGLLYKLAGQMIRHLQSYLSSERDVHTLLSQRHRFIADRILSEMLAHRKEAARKIMRVARLNQGFCLLEPLQLVLYEGETIRDYRQAADSHLPIKRQTFDHFEKCCYPAQKFDSEDERRFAYVLEKSEEVRLWMKPSRGLVKIHWGGQRNYNPDFIVESRNERYIVEVKAENQLKQDDVRTKAESARQWCYYANAQSKGMGSLKPWRYALIPDKAIAPNSTFGFLAQNYRAEPYLPEQALT